MPSPPNENYWVTVDGSRYFIRFGSHVPKPRWFTSPNRDLAFCFASTQDAQHVVGQLMKYGRRARIVTVRRRPEPTPHPPEPALGEPPPRLRPWINRILQTGRANGKADGNPAHQINAGYRLLAREYHPDHGGTRAAMQELNDAVEWLRDNRAW